MYYIYENLLAGHGNINHFASKLQIEILNVGCFKIDESAIRKYADLYDIAIV